MLTHFINFNAFYGMLIVYILAAGPGVAGEVTGLELVVIAAAVGISARAALPHHGFTNVYTFYPC